MAKITTGQRYHDLDFSAATLSLSNSPSFNLRSLGGLFFGILIKLIGLSERGHPHSILAIFQA
tara:strand:+ start:264 stop:452 length:189 start_codon:yes stop_codon:yes gene_type:complete